MKLVWLLFHPVALMLYLRDKLIDLFPWPEYADYKWILHNATRIAINIVAVAFGASFATWLLRHWLVPGNVVFETDLDFAFDQCVDRSGPGMCSFPTANVSLFSVDGTLFFEPLNYYNVYLDLIMPESPVNQNHGMFVTSLKMLNRYGIVQDSVYRSAMLQYKSRLFSWLSTIVYFPILFLNFANENQTISLNFFKQYAVRGYDPAFYMMLQVQSYHIQIFRAHLRISASLGYFRTFLFEWPFTSTLLLLFLNAACLAGFSLTYWTLRSSLFVYRRYVNPQPLPAAKKPMDLLSLPSSSSSKAPMPASWERAALTSQEPFRKRPNGNNPYTTPPPARLPLVANENIPISKTERLRQNFTNNVQSLAQQISRQDSVPKQDNSFLPKLKEESDDDAADLALRKMSSPKASSGGVGGFFQSVLRRRF